MQIYGRYDLVCTGSMLAYPSCSWRVPEDEERSDAPPVNHLPSRFLYGRDRDRYGADFRLSDEELAEIERFQAEAAAAS